jgi:hypothetical protein
MRTPLGVNADFVEERQTLAPSGNLTEHVRPEPAEDDGVS